MCKYTSIQLGAAACKICGWRGAPNVDAKDKTKTELSTERGACRLSLVVTSELTRLPFFLIPSPPLSISRLISVTSSSYFHPSSPIPLVLELMLPCAAARTIPRPRRRYMAKASDGKYREEVIVGERNRFRAVSFTHEKNSAQQEPPPILSLESD